MWFGTNISYPSALSVSEIGLVRDSFQDYLEDFEYSKERNPKKPEKPSFHEVLFGVKK